MAPRYSSSPAASAIPAMLTNWPRWRASCARNWAANWSGGSARLLCRCSAPAANEPGHMVEAAVYTVEVRGAIAAQAEIAELHWIDPGRPDVPVARLSREHILPLLSSRIPAQRCVQVPAALQRRGTVRSGLEHGESCRTASAGHRSPWGRRRSRCSGPSGRNICAPSPAPVPVVTLFASARSCPGNSAGRPSTQ